MLPSLQVTERDGKVVCGFRRSGNRNLKLSFLFFVRNSGIRMRGNQVATGFRFYAEIYSSFLATIECTRVYSCNKNSGHFAFMQQLFWSRRVWWASYRGS